MIASLALAFVAFTQAATDLEDSIEAGLGVAGLSARTARFDDNLLPLFRQGEFTTTFYTAASENPWRLPFFVRVYRSELAAQVAKPSDAMMTGARLVGFATRRTLIGDPIASAATAAKKPDALQAVLDRMRLNGVIEAIPNLDTVPAPVQEAAALLLTVAENVRPLRDAAIGKAGPPNSLYRLLEKQGPDDNDVAAVDRFLTAYRSVDLRYMGAGAHDLMLAAQTAEAILATVDPAAKYSVAIDTRWGRIELSGGEDSTHAGPALLILDTGGSDTYLNCPSNAGPENWASVVIDRAGNDRYLSDPSLASTPIAKFAGRKGATNLPGPAGALLGYAFLIDSGGDDLYRTHRPGLGSARVGAAVLLDKAGNDQYDSYQDSEGFGMFGAGVLEDLAGVDSYRGFTQVQGVGQTAGFGYLVDRQGSDTYVADDEAIDFPSAQSAQHNTSMSQGAGNGRRADYIDGHSLAGGVGILFDQAGNDVYSSAVFGQGVGYWEGVGMLLDSAGDDRYTGMWYVQGAAAHFAIGYLEDELGADSYTATMNMAQGAGHDFSVGGLVDRVGNDTYKAPNLSLGAGNANGIGFLFELAGDDRYETSGITLGQAAEATAGSVRERAICFGLFLDLAGADAYPAGIPFAKDGGRQSNPRSGSGPASERQMGVFWDRR